MKNVHMLEKTRNTSMEKPNHFLCSRSNKRVNTPALNHQKVTSERLKKRLWMEFGTSSTSTPTSYRESNVLGGENEVSPVLPLWSLY